LLAGLNSVWSKAKPRAKTRTRAKLAPITRLTNGAKQITALLGASAAANVR
jgi:hypothetical protein